MSRNIPQLHCLGSELTDLVRRLMSHTVSRRQGQDTLAEWMWQMRLKFKTPSSLLGVWIQTYLGVDFNYFALKKKKIWNSRNLGGPSGEDSWLLARFQLNQILLILMKCEVSPSPPRPRCTSWAAWLTGWYDSAGGNLSGLCEFTSCGGIGRTHSGNIPVIFLLINACRLEGSLGLLQTFILKA